MARLMAAMFFSAYTESKSTSGKSCRYKEILSITLQQRSKHSDEPVNRRLATVGRKTSHEEEEPTESGWREAEQIVRMLMMTS